MSDEKKQSWGVTVVYTGLSKEDADEIQTKFLGRHTPDVVEAQKRYDALLNMQLDLIGTIYKLASMADFEERNETLITHPEMVMNDIIQRTKKLLDIYTDVMTGHIEITPIDMKDIAERLK